jgi:xylan 1,4-beta-xylosidase
MEECIIENPILRGFHPDASAVHVGDTFYIAVSTFEWWPGIDIYESKDLIHWKWAAAPIDRKEMAPDLAGNYNSGSLWAPHLSYTDGEFWLCYTDVKSSTQFKDTLNYISTAPDITGPWSAPVFVTASGFDPSLFHEGKRSWFLNMLYDWRPGHERFAGTVIQEFDRKTKKLIGQRSHFYHGSSFGVSEGPQILKKDGYYYLLSAAGGTGYSHAAVVARAHSLQGPWEDSPWMPLLTAKDDPENLLQKSGHACFIENKGEWYITHICARPLNHLHGSGMSQRDYSPLGRETSLQKIVWEDGWPHLANGTCHPETCVKVKTDDSSYIRQEYEETILFNQIEEMPPSFKTLRIPLQKEKDYSFTERKGWLRLYGSQSLSSLHHQTLFARRWESFHFSAEMALEFDPENFQQTAGLILFYDTSNWLYEFVTYDEEKKTRIIQIMRADGNEFHMESDPFPIPDGEIILRTEVNEREASFFCQSGQKAEQILLDHVDVWQLSEEHIREKEGRLAFSGSMVGMAAQDMDAHKSFADIRYWKYKEMK